LFVWIKKKGMLHKQVQCFFLCDNLQGYILLIDTVFHPKKQKTKLKNNNLQGYDRGHSPTVPPKSHVNHWPAMGNSLLSLKSKKATLSRCNTVPII